MLHGGNERVLEPASVIVVGVPDDAGPVDGGDKAGAGFDEATGQQVGLAPAMTAIAFANGVRFAGKIEGFGGFTGLQEGDGFLVEGIDIGDIGRSDGDC